MGGPFLPSGSPFEKGWGTLFAVRGGGKEVEKGGKGGKGREGRGGKMLNFPPSSMGKDNFFL